MSTTREPWQPKTIPKLVAVDREQARAERIAAAGDSQRLVTRTDGAYLYAALDHRGLAWERTDAES